MASPITEASVLAAFDEKVRDGIVMYAEDMEKIYHEDGGFKVSPFSLLFFTGFSRLLLGHG